MRTRLIVKSYQVQTNAGRGGSFQVKNENQQATVVMVAIYMAFISKRFKISFVKKITPSAHPT